MRALQLGSFVSQRSKRLENLMKQLARLKKHKETRALLPKEEYELFWGERLLHLLDEVWVQTREAAAQEGDSGTVDVQLQSTRQVKPQLLSGLCESDG